MTQTGAWEKLRPPTQGALLAQARLETGLELQESWERWALQELVSGMSRAPGEKEVCRALHRAAHLPMNGDEQIGVYFLLPCLKT